MPNQFHPVCDNYSSSDSTFIPCISRFARLARLRSLPSTPNSGLKRSLFPSLQTVSHIVLFERRLNGRPAKHLGCAGSATKPKRHSSPECSSSNPWTTVFPSQLSHTTCRPATLRPAPTHQFWQSRLGRHQAHQLWQCQYSRRCCQS